MNRLNALFRHPGINKLVVWVLFAFVFITDFLTPLGFAHGILYAPVLICAMTLPGLGRRFQLVVLVSSLLATAAYYFIAPNLSNLPDWYILTNRLLSGAILLLTYEYFRKLRSLVHKNREIHKLEQAQRQTLDDFINALPIQIWLANPRGEVDFVSTSLISFSGKQGDVILADWLALLHPDDRERTIDVWSQSVETGAPYRIDFRLKRHDGEYVWHQTQAIAQRDGQGQIIRWLGSSMDIDSLLRFREEAERLALQYRHTVESITDAFFTLDHDFRFTYLNQNAADVLGSSIDDLLGATIWEKCNMGYDSPFAVQYRRAAESQQKLHFEEYYTPGSKWLEVYVYPSPEGLTVSCEDVSERREMEQRLRESQKLEAVGHLTGGVAHDFNNLLTVILGNAEMLAERVADPHLKPMADMTVSAAQRGAELTSRLLAFARRKPLDPKSTDINQLVDAMQTLIRRTLPENIDIDCVPDPDLGIAEIDASELDTALLNLVVNARDAMPGGGKLTIETGNAILDEHYTLRNPEVTPGEYVMLGVSDTGTGMAPDTIARAIEPFYTTKAVGKGSGLGLSMVYGFTKQSGGHLKIYSEPGEGTTIKLYFPRVSRTHHLLYQPENKSTPQGGTEHIVIAEDDKLVLQHLETQLRLLGYRVTAVESGPAALEALRTRKDVDLLLTDIIMPGGMNGRELADKARSTYPSLRVLFTSGYTENAIVHHGRLDPGVELLSKPYTRLELATKVRRVLDGPLQAS